MWHKQMAALAVVRTASKDNPTFTRLDRDGDHRLTAEEFSL